MSSSSEFKITPISSPPAYLTPEQHDVATSTTPDSFSNIAPKLILGLEKVTIHAQPSLADIENGEGTLWVTEHSMSYLPSTSQGFSLPYPLIALHAISSTVPASFGSDDGKQCIYCQIDDSAAQLQEDEAEDEDGVEEEMGLREMWIIPSNSEDVEPLFSALSHCASLHPSTLDGDEDGNPFASLGPFGTGSNGGGLAQFDDAEEEEGEAGLSDTGRFQLARLEALLNSPSGEDDMGEEAPSIYTRATTLDAEKEATSTEGTEETNVLLLASHPQPLPSLFSAPLLQSLLALLDAYAPVLGWDPQPDEGRMRVVFDDRAGSSENRKNGIKAGSSPMDRIVQTLHGLPLETTEDHDGPLPTLRVERQSRVDISSLLPSQLSASLPSLRIPTASTTTTTSAFQPTDHLLPPITDRNFLISPPGSPPIGWEPIKEDPPNRETLAVDLIEALRKLGREMGNDEADPSQDAVAGSKEAGASRATMGGRGQVQVVLPPTHRRLPSLAGDDSPLIPAVTVQAFDDEEEDDDVGTSSQAGVTIGGNRNRIRPDITQVKATVDALRGPLDSFEDGNHGHGHGQGGGNRITPTGRPPLV